MTNEQISAIQRAKESKIPIIFAEYDGVGETNSALKTAVGDYKDVRYFKKSTNGVLTTTTNIKKTSKIF